MATAGEGDLPDPLPGAFEVEAEEAVAVPQKDNPVVSAPPEPTDPLRLGLNGPPVNPRVATSNLHNEPSPPTPPDVLRKRREAKPKRPILKRPAPAASRFNFKRDILQPINSRFVYPEGASPIAEVPSTLWKSTLGRWAGAPTAAAPTEPPKEAPLSPAASSSAPVAAPPPAAPALLSVAPLKGVRFTMASLSVIYPINANGQLPPSDEAATKKRVEKEFRKAVAERKVSVGSAAGRSKAATPSSGWTGAELDRLYDECCRSREEFGLAVVKAAFQDNLTTPPRSLDLTHQQLSLGAALALSDLLSVDWGLRKLVLEDTQLDDDTLKPLIHALLVSATLPTLSLANNKRIRARGWRLIAVLVSKAPKLAFLDVSDNPLDKRTVDWLMQAITAGSAAALPSEKDVDRSDEAAPLMPTAPLLREGGRAKPGALASLKFDNCGLKNQALEALAHGIRVSVIKHISLRRNRISALGAVALAVMMRDYSIASDATGSTSSPVPASPSPHLNGAATLPPPLPPKQQSSLSPLLNGHDPVKRSPQLSPSQDELDEDASFGLERKPLLGERWQPSEARSRLQKQIDALPRVGSLLTLDVKGNEIKNGVVYIAQVLKRNRTLRVLNLSENKIEASGLAAIAEALRYNSTLETLDMSRNPCSGPGLEGILALRTAFSYNTSLMRVFLNATDLSSEGAICLAEFLPEVKTLIHLDVTENYDIDIAGVMALAAAIKMNTTLRCLDLNIPPNDPDFSRLSQDILQSCIRNTEIAQEESAARGNKQPIAAPIHKSAVARNLEEAQHASDTQQRRRRRSGSTVGTLLGAAQTRKDLLAEVVATAEARRANRLPVGVETLRELADDGRAARMQVLEALPLIKPSDRRDRLVTLAEEIHGLCARANSLLQDWSTGMEPLVAQTTPSKPPLAMFSSPTTPNSPHLLSPNSTLSSNMPPSPSFSITDSDDDDFDNSDTESSAEAAAPGPSAAEAKAEADTEDSQTSTEDEHMDEPVAGPPSLHLSTDVAPEMNAETGWAALDLSPRSPVETASRTLTLEEGEVFRRKAILDARADSSGSEDGDDDVEARKDVSGEELRKEILEAEVPEDRSHSPRSIPLSPPPSPRTFRRPDFFSTPSSASQDTLDELSHS